MRAFEGFLQTMTLTNYRYVLDHPLALTAFKNNFYLSVASATPIGVPQKLGAKIGIAE